MARAHTVRAELLVLLRLSAPVTLTQIGLMMMGVVDTMMVGRLGVTELAASALGNMWQWTFLSMGLGLILGVDPLISQAHGRGDGPGTALALQRGIILALLVSVPICGCMLLSEKGLLLLGQDPAVAELAGRYNLLKLPTIPCFLVYSALRQYLQGRTLMAPATWVIWIGNAVHAVLNWVLIFGRLGMPSLRMDGAAIASSISTALLLLGLIAWVRLFRLHEGAWRPWDRASLSRSGLLHAARLGLPVGIQISLEATAFSLSTIMAGWLGTTAVGSHHVVLNMASLAFMVPLGISQGAATRIGNLIGAGDAVRMRVSVRAALILGAFVMLLSATVFTLMRMDLPRLFTEDASVIVLAAQVLPIAGAFQISDGTQVVAGGALRGMGRPDAAALVNLLGYYVLGLPLAYFLAFRSNSGLPGVWIGLALGLTLVASALALWAIRTARRPLAELRVKLEPDVILNT